MVSLVSLVSTIREREGEMSKQPRPRGPRNSWKSWSAWSLQEARMAGQTELPFPRAVDPKIKAAKAELRRQRRRRKRMGVFTSINETTAAPADPGHDRNERR